MANKKSYDFYLSDNRRRYSTVGYSNIYEALLSDRSRIMYSSSFRRLQSKAQVFSLEDRSAVRSRLTHSLEVSDIGRRIAYKLAQTLLDEKKIEHQTAQAIPVAVENACLLHDLGNPPFGHFGEAAINNWFKECFEGDLKEERSSLISTEHQYDFTRFDGNQQGLRIVLRLHRDKDEYGLNLTATTLLSYLKYPEPTWAQKPKYRKRGIFATEYDDIVSVRNSSKTPLNKRHPLVYLVEAADDIAYCISDVEDSVEKGLITPYQFITDLKIEWEQLNLKWSDFPIKDQAEKILNAGPHTRERSYFFDFKVSYARHFIEETAKIYLLALTNDNIDDAAPILERDKLTKSTLDAMKNYSRKYIFRHRDAEDKEVAGFKIISGILNCLRPLLLLSQEKFSLLVKSRDKPAMLYGQHLDYEWRLFNRLPSNYVNCYNDAIKDGACNNELEMFQRCHLIVDCVAGMTDRYSLENYQLLHGIRV
jgi:dGTPase